MIDIPGVKARVVAVVPDGRTAVGGSDYGDATRVRVERATGTGLGRADGPAGGLRDMGVPADRSGGAVASGDGTARAALDHQHPRAPRQELSRRPLHVSGHAGARHLRAGHRHVGRALEEHRLELLLGADHRVAQRQRAAHREVAGIEHLRHVAVAGGFEAALPDVAPGSDDVGDDVDAKGFGHCGFSLLGRFASV